MANICFFFFPVHGHSYTEKEKREFGSPQANNNGKYETAEKYDRLALSLSFIKH